MLGRFFEFLFVNVNCSCSAIIFLHGEIKIFPNDDLTGTGTAIASTISVPADASLVVIDKTTSFYLLEDQSIGATASAANDLVVTVSWEEIN